MKRIRKISFSKTHKYFNYDEYKVITDSGIIKVINNLCNKHNILIKTIKLKDGFFDNDCYITIKADKIDFNSFCIDFIEALDGYIENINF